MKHDLLLWYFIHKPDLVCNALYQSGRRLQQDWELAFCRNSTHKFTPTNSSNSNINSINTANIKAEYYQKILNALNFVGKPYLDQILIETLCNGKPMQQFEKQMHIRLGTGSYILKIALSRLHSHYLKIDEYEKYKN